MREHLFHRASTIMMNLQQSKQQNSLSMMIFSFFFFFNVRSHQLENPSTMSCFLDFERRVMSTAWLVMLVLLHIASEIHRGAKRAEQNHQECNQDNRFHCDAKRN
jgi:hypothetical protein